MERGKDLLRLVFSWSLEDILNDDLYRDRVWLLMLITFTYPSFIVPLPLLPLLKHSY